jgi:hypothetical protein
MKLHTVLRPPNYIACAAEDFARNHFASDNMGYCIGTNGHLPHITLIQTTVSDDFNIESLFNDIMGLFWDKDTLIKLGDYYHRQEKPYNGLEMIKHPAVQRIHELCASVHGKHGLEIESGHGDEFWPHLTFAKSQHRLTEPVKIPPILRQPSNGWTLEFGYRGEHSVYLGPFTP